MVKRIFLFLGVCCFMFTASVVISAPYADINVKAKQNEDGTYTYRLKLRNQGPVMSQVTTPPWHIVYTMAGSALDAGGKLLDDDENIVLLGVDTGRDDVVISHVRSFGSPLRGGEEAGWRDSDVDNIPNQVVVWHPPFGPWPDGTAIKHGESLKVSFRANKKLFKLIVWVGGSDDNIIWNEKNEMAEDTFGIYDGTEGKYLATFFERHIHVKHQIKHHKVKTN